MAQSPDRDSAGNAGRGVRLSPRAEVSPEPLYLPPEFGDLQGRLDDLERRLRELAEED